MLDYTRRSDWTARWSEFIQDTHDLQDGLKMDWEHVNCMQFFGQGCEALTGHNPYEELGWDEIFTDADGAAAAIQSRGYKTLTDVIAEHFKEIPIAFIWPGDLVLLHAVPYPGMSRLATTVMPYGAALANPPHYYAVGVEGAGRGDLYASAVKGFAVGHEPEVTL